MLPNDVSIFLRNWNILFFTLDCNILILIWAILVECGRYIHCTMYCTLTIVTSKLLKMLKLVPCNSFKRDPNNCRASNTQLNKIMRHNCHSDSRSNLEPLEHSTSDAFNRRGSPMNGSKMIQEKFSFSFIIWCFKKKKVFLPNSQKSRFWIHIGSNLKVVVNIITISRGQPLW